MTTRRTRLCFNNHRFTTIEIPASAYGTVKERLAATAKTAATRAEFFKRDRFIAGNLHQGWHKLAEQFKLTRTAVYLAAKRGRNAGK